jgi:DNA polymerase III sliding clamp (beta) subunit (PCNA family)
MLTITVNGKEFIGALSFVLKLALKQPKSSLWGGVLLEAQRNKLTLTAFEGDGLQVSKEIWTQGDGDSFSMFLRGAGALEQLISKEGAERNGGELSLEATWDAKLGHIEDREGKVTTEGGCILRVVNERRGSSGAYCLIGDASKGFAAKKPPADGERAAISGARLQKILAQLSKAPFSTDEGRPIMAGVHFAKTKDDKTLALVTDGHRMIAVEAEELAVLAGVTLPKLTLRFLSDLGSGLLTVRYTKDAHRSSLWFVNQDGAALHTRTLEAITGHTFPQAVGFLDEEVTHNQVVFERADLMNALKGLGASGAKFALLAFVPRKGLTSQRSYASNTSPS